MVLPLSLTIWISASGNNPAFPKLQISMTKTNYLVFPYFAGIVNNPGYINLKKLLWIAQHICKIAKS